MPPQASQATGVGGSRQEGLTPQKKKPRYSAGRRDPPASPHPRRGAVKCPENVCIRYFLKHAVADFHYPHATLVPPRYSVLEPCLFTDMIEFPAGTKS